MQFQARFSNNTTKFFNAPNAKQAKVKARQQAKKMGKQVAVNEIRCVG